MSDNATDPTKDAGTKTFTQEDLDREKAYAQKFKQEIEEYKTKLKPFESINLDQYKKDLEELNNVRKKGALSDPQKFEEEIKRTEQSVRATVQKTIDEITTERDGLKSRIKELEVTERVFGVAATKFNADTHDDVKAYIRKYGDVDENGNIVFKDAKGNLMYIEGSTTQAMKAEDFVKWLVNQRPSWAVPTARSGTADKGERRSGNHYSSNDFANMTPGQINDAISQGGEAGAAAAQAFLRSVKLV